MELVDKLKYFGLTGQEATIYLTLMGSEGMTGYEAAKTTGISRSNTYTALAGLVDKGASYVMEGKVTIYTAVPLDEFCKNRIRKMETLRDEMLQELPVVRRAVEGYFTINGAERIMDKMKNMIDGAAARVYVAASQPVLEEIRPELEEAVARHLKVVVIAAPGFKLPGAIIHYGQRDNTQIRLISDSATVLTGDLKDGADATCLYSSKQNLVDLFKETLKNEITLIQLTADREGKEQ